MAAVCVAAVCVYVCMYVSVCVSYPAMTEFLSSTAALLTVSFAPVYTHTHTHTHTHRQILVHAVSPVVHRWFKCVYFCTCVCVSPHSPMT